MGAAKDWSACCG